MASLFGRKSFGPWWVAWIDHSDRRRYASTRTTDRPTAKRIGSKLEADAALRRSGVVNARDEQLAAQDRVPLSEHVADYVRHLELLGRTEKHVRATSCFLETLDECLGTTHLSGITQDAVERYLHGLKAKGKSARTLNWRQSLVAGFLAWAVRTGRLDASPLRALRRQDETRNRKRRRWPLTSEELAAIFRVAEKRLRRPFYAAAYFAGLRRGELERLTWSDVNLDAATLTISKGKARNRVDVLPIAARLRRQLKAIRPALAPASAHVFTQCPTNEERRADFKVAGIAFKDSDGRVADLHSLRSTLATDFARRAVSVQVVQRLTRHSDLNLTPRAYTKLRVDDLADGLAELSRPDALSKKARRRRRPTSRFSFTPSG